jgi:hypothetical protein
MLIMKRQDGDVTLHVRGRDIEEARETHPVHQGCTWTIVGEAAKVRRSDERSRVPAVLRDA